VCLDQAHAVRCPVLLLNGDGEVNNLQADFFRLAARLPAAHAEIVANSGHAIQDDQPELLLAKIRAFLAALP
jgi:valacyclovir hydrolase